MGPLNSPDYYRTKLQEQTRLLRNQVEKQKEARDADPKFVRKEFFHKVLDSVSFLPSELEGLPSYKAATAVYEDLKEFQSDSKDPDVVKATGVMEKVLQYELSSVFIQNQFNARKPEAKEYFQAFCNLLKKDISELTSTDAPLIFHGGNKEHAVLCEVKRLPNNNLEFKIINRGRGSEEHRIKGFLGWLNPKAKIQTLIITDVKPEKIEQGSFLEELIGLYFENPLNQKSLFQRGWDSLKSFFGVGGEPIYKLVKEVLVTDLGKQIKKVDDPRYWHKPQNQGTCTIKVYTAWLHTYLSDLTVREYKVFSTEKMLKKIKRLDSPDFLSSPDSVISQQGAIARKNLEKLPPPTLFERAIYFLRNEAPNSYLARLGETVLEKRRQKWEQLAGQLEEDGGEG